MVFNARQQPIARNKRSKSYIKWASAALGLKNKKRSCCRTLRWLEPSGYFLVFNNTKPYSGRQLQTMRRRARGGRGRCKVALSRAKPRWYWKAIA